MEKLDKEIIVLKDAGAEEKVEKESSSLVAPYPYTVIRPPFKGSFLSIPCVGWMTPLLFLGAKRPLENEDLTDLPRGLKANSIASYMESRSTLFSVVATRFGWKILVTIFFQCLSVACILIIPTFLQQIIFYIDLNKTDLFIQSGPVLCVILTLLQIGVVFFANASQQVANVLRVELKTLLIGSLYEKSFLLSRNASRTFTNGRILNSINVDVERVSGIFFVLAQFVTSPIQVIVTVILLSNLIGVAVWSGLGVVLVIIPLQMLLFGLLPIYQKAIMEGGDKRLKLLREVFYGIKIIKFRALEKFFADRISLIRNDQVSFLLKFYITLAYSVGMFFLANSAMPIVAFMTYAAINGGDMSASIIFPSLSLFQGLFQPILGISQHTSTVLMAIVSFRRINEILVSEEGDVETINNVSPPGSISATNLTCQWESVGQDIKEPSISKETPAAPKKPKSSWFTKNETSIYSNPIAHTEGNLVNLQEAAPFKVSSVSFSISPGRKVAIVGPVGSGKSSLLSGLIKEMPMQFGSLEIGGKIAYCNQQPWILTDTIEGNIVFNQPFDQEKLDMIVKVCGLEKDLELFPAGLKTEIGEKGINLSGGQKARVSLARALYFSPDILLLDDPISALDAQVGSFVFTNAIQEYASTKTVLLVTHQLHLLPGMDWIMVMDNGVLVQQGSYKDLMKDENGNLFSMMRNYKLDDEPEMSLKLSSSTIYNADEVTFDEKDKSSLSKTSKIIDEEEKMTGSVAFSVFKHYIDKCGGLLFAVPVLFLALLCSGIQMTTSLWLSWWTTNKFNLGLAGYMRGYGFLGLGQFASSLMMNSAILFGSYQAAKYYHPTALSALFHAPVSYFDAQPIGRLLNRMSKDIESIDFGIWNALLNVTYSGASVFASLCFVCYVDQRMLALVLPLVVLYFFIAKYYQKSNIEFKRFESNNRSPLYAHVSETLAGISVVKAYGVKADFIRKQRVLMDESNVPYFLRLQASNWLNIRMGFLSSLLTLLLCILGIVSAIEPSLIGVSLTYAIGFAESLSGLLFSYSRLENELNSVERLKVFCDDLPSESSSTLETDPSPSQWPIRGLISFSNVSLSYPSRPDVLILKNLNFDISAGEKVGIIGRTGSGKSTIMAALFRLVELLEGSITIDAKDISKLGLSTLRKAIQIIPQEPVLFTGTIRENLDIESTYSDQDVWDVLERIGMKEYVESLGDLKLSSPVTENGENLSVGQRQLICLGRAILVKPLILIMDEATASVDGEADKLIQRSIKTYFADTTVLSIAHRLNTIADFDRVLVLQEGERIEFDSPHALLSRPESLFSQLADATGSANAALLRQIAFEAAHLLSN